MAPKERAGVVDNSSKSAKANKRVTAPSYNGAQTSAPVELKGPANVVGVSVAAQIYSRADSLRYALSQLTETLTGLGIYEPAPAKGEDLAQAAHQNVLRALNEELNWATKAAQDVLYVSVYGTGDSEGDDCEDADKIPDGAIFNTEYGRSVYNDSQTLIDRMSSIRRMARRLSGSFIGEAPYSDERGACVTASVHACLTNLIEHADDTVSELHRLNSDLLVNLLGVEAQ